nr:MAG TPA: hypothetical protein [Caudoviricetes sp.]
MRMQASTTDRKAPSEGRLRAEDSPKGSAGAKPALAGRQKRGA